MVIMGMREVNLWSSNERVVIAWMGLHTIDVLMIATYHERERERETTREVMFYAYLFYVLVLISYTITQLCRRAWTSGTEEQHTHTDTFSKRWHGRFLVLVILTYIGVFKQLIRKS